MASNPPTLTPSPSAAPAVSPSPIPIPTATPRPSYRPYPPITVPLQAVLLADEDGTRAATVTPEAIASWVDRLNETYAVAGIRFTFDPAADVSKVRSTTVNNIANPEFDPAAAPALAAANQIGARYPGKLTVLFRHGTGYGGVGSAFSTPDASVVVMPGFDPGPGPCSQGGAWMLAHEIGHYLGLTHTFASVYATDDDAATALKKANGDTAAFDGDGLADTPPDPYITAHQCDQVPAVVLDDTALLIPRSNVMSYYDGASELSPQQIERIRPVLEARVAAGMAWPANNAIPSPIEAESLTSTSEPPYACSTQHMDVNGLGRWSADAQLVCFLGQGGKVTLELPLTARTGRYRLTLYLTRGQGYGTVQATLDGKRLGDPFDAYAPVMTPAEPIVLDNVLLAKGSHALELEVVGTNPASGSHIVGVDALTVTPQP